MAKEYVDYRDSAYFVAGTRVSLDSVVHAFLRGESPEGVLESFPALTLEQIFGSLSYYLGNRDAIDAYLREGQQDFERIRSNSRARHPELYTKLAAARERSQARS